MWYSTTQIVTLDCLYPEDNVVKYNHILLFQRCLTVGFILNQCLIQRDKAVQLIQERASRAFPKKAGQFILNVEEL